jgi:cytochrome c oxidase assembly factor CtaG
MPVLLHGGHDVSLGVWHFEPSVVAIAVIVVGLYFYGVFRTPGAREPLRVAAFLTGCLVMFIALVSPLDTAADRLLSMHMLQHVFLTTIGPPLVLLGLPPALFRPLLAAADLRALFRLATHPVFAGALFIVNMWFWHVPPVYEQALYHTSAHITMHVAFMATGLLFWWPVINPLPGLARYGDGARLLYLFATGMPMALLAMLFFASGSVIYDYYETAQPLWGISPINDQQIAGLIMGALGEAASFAAITLLFFRFLDREEAAQVPGRIDAA